jgi:RES domain-containing protein
MLVYRLSRAKYANSLSGIGASMYGARWNSKGVEMIYTATNRSLAMAEVAVHFSLATMPVDYMMITVNIPDDVSIESVKVKALPAGWQTFPHPKSTKLIGDKFVQDGNSCLLRVPSSVTKGDFNILINPHHQEFKSIKIIETEPFPFDDRLFK